MLWLVGNCRSQQSAWLVERQQVLVLIQHRNFPKFARRRRRELDMTGHDAERCRTRAAGHSTLGPSAIALALGFLCGPTDPVLWSSQQSVQPRAFGFSVEPHVKSLVLPALPNVIYEGR